jgi:hypothetical protein
MRINLNVVKAYSVRDRTTIDGVAAERRRESLVFRSGWDESTTLAGMRLLMVE